MSLFKKRLHIFKFFQYFPHNLLLFITYFVAFMLIEYFIFSERERQESMSK